MRVRIRAFIVVVTACAAAWFAPYTRVAGRAPQDQVDVAAVRAQLTDPEYQEFQRWVAIGPGGLPHTLDGYRTLQRLNRQLRSPFDVSALANRIGKPGDVATLRNLPQRGGSRPSIAPFAIPHRQLDQHNTPPVREKQKAILADAIRDHSSAVQFQRSYFEMHNDAVFLRNPAAGNQTVVPASHGEVGHLHPSDGSMHFSLSPSDTKEVVAKGWGELHGLAGQVYGENRELPATYTMIYSPRTDEELAIARQIVRAGVRFSSAPVKAAGSR